MKVLEIIKGLDIGGLNGGSEQFGLNLSRYLHTQEALDVRLCAFYECGSPVEKSWVERLQAEGIPVLFALPCAGRFFWNGFARLSAYCRDQKIDIVHSHNHIGSLAAVFLKRNKSLPVVLRTAHAGTEWGRGPLAWINRQVFSGWIYPLVMDAQIGVSKAIVERLARCPGTRLSGRIPRLIYNAMPEGEVPDLSLPSYTTGGRSEFIIGSVGRLTKIKDYPTLLKAFRQFLSSVPNARLVLVGEGEESLKLHDLAKDLGIEDRVEFAGQQTNPLAYLARMDVFVLPSLSEGLPTSILEAAACGTPVVASDIPGTRELVEDGKTGWLVPVSDPEALVKTLLEVYRSPEKRVRFAAQAALTITQYTYPAAARQYAELYRQLTGPI